MPDQNNSLLVHGAMHCNLPPSTTTTTCKEKCPRTFSACSATDSTTTSDTITIACPSPTPFTGSLGSILAYTGDFSYTMREIPDPPEDDEEPTSTASTLPAWPTKTITSRPDDPDNDPSLVGKCLADLDGYPSFSKDDAEDAIRGLCYGQFQDTLRWPDPGFIVLGETAGAWVDWTDDQLECSPHSKGWELGDYCWKVCTEYILAPCDNWDEKGKYYGGGIVLDNERFGGCVQFGIVHTKLMDALERANNGTALRTITVGAAPRSTAGPDP